MADILYRYNKQVYFNITNRCCCNCTFCIRNHQEHYGESDSLWLEKEPSVKEIIDAIEVFDFGDCEEVVFCGYAVDCISISLNMPDAKSYAEVVRPVYGEQAFEAMLHFAKDCKKYLSGNIRFSVVDVIGEENIEKCRSLAESLEIPLHIRAYS